MKSFKLTLFLAATLSFMVTAFAWGFTAPATGAFLFLVVASSLLRDQTGECHVTLSVPEILMDVMAALRLELFPLRRFSTDYSSKTAVKGDLIYSHIATLPAVTDYDATYGFLGTGGTPTEADAILTDVPVKLAAFKICPVRVKYLTQLASKLPLYREAIRNTGYALAKAVLDATLGGITVSGVTYGGIRKNHFTSEIPINAANFNLDTLELIRTTLNTQKAAGSGRMGILNSTFAAALQNDDRVKSSLFYAQLNGDRGYRVFRNIAGFEEIIEYPDLPQPDAAPSALAGFFCDPRAIVIANRQVDFANASVELRVPQIMEFVPMEDPETGLAMTGVGWQQPGTGDVIFSPAVLFGTNSGEMQIDVGASTSGAGAGTAADYAAVRLVEG